MCSDVGRTQNAKILPDWLKEIVVKKTEPVEASQDEQKVQKDVKGEARRTGAAVDETLKKYGTSGDAGKDMANVKVNVRDVAMSERSTTAERAAAIKQILEKPPVVSAEQKERNAKWITLWTPVMGSHPIGDTLLVECDRFHYCGRVGTLSDIPERYKDRVKDGDFMQCRNYVLENSDRDYWYFDSKMALIFDAESEEACTKQREINLKEKFDQLTNPK